MQISSACKCTPSTCRRACSQWCLMTIATSLGALLYIIISCRESSKVIHSPKTIDIPHAAYIKPSSQVVVTDRQHNKLLRYNLSHTVRAIDDAYHKNWVGFVGLEHVNCHKAFNQSLSNKLFPPRVNRTFPPEILADAKNCSSFIAKYGFGRYPTPTKEELDFPIAYSILFHKDLDQVLFLLRAIYHPHNVYCLNIDTKASIRMLRATRAVAQCLSGVFVASRLDDVVYAGISRLRADLNCFRDLLGHPVKWRYVINSPGQQFPLRTNLELVQILTLMAGTNDVLGRTGVQTERYSKRHSYIVNGTTGEVTLLMTNTTNPPPPQSVTVVKCSAYGAFSRDFVSFALHSPLAKELLSWSQNIYSPDEIFWATLNFNHISPAPGGFLGPPDENPWLSSFAAWRGAGHCASDYFIRDICIFGPADLPNLASNTALFANKFYVDLNPAALQCLDQRIYNHTFIRKEVDRRLYAKILARRFQWRNSTYSMNDTPSAEGHVTEAFQEDFQV